MTNRIRSTVVAAGTLLVLSGAALAQYSTTFEAPTYAGSAAGTLLTNGFGGGGQDGWYNPVSGSVDNNVYTYAGNALGINANTFGSDQFIAGVSSGGAALGRAQHDVNFTSGTWTTAWDMAVLYNGTLPSANNLGSFSLQPSTTNRTWQTLYNWVDNNTTEAWNCAFMPFNAAGVQQAQPGILPDPAFGGLAPNKWYRISATFDFVSNKITSVSITDIAAGTTTTIAPVDWYMSGGTSPTPPPLATAVRHFAGGAAGNIVAVDNMSIKKVCYPDCNGDGVLNLADFGCFQTKFALGDPYADCNGDGVLNLADFGCFQTKFALGC